MARCINPKCGIKINDAYYFCPACGADNRPPEERVPLAKHRHRYERFREYCVWCGESNCEPFSFGRKTRLGISLAMVVAGLLLVFASVRVSDNYPRTADGEDAAISTKPVPPDKLFAKESAEQKGFPLFVIGLGVTAYGAFMFCRVRLTAEKALEIIGENDTHMPFWI